MYKAKNKIIYRDSTLWDYHDKGLQNVGWRSNTWTAKIRKKAIDGIWHGLKSPAYVSVRTIIHRVRKKGVTLIFLPLTLSSVVHQPFAILWRRVWGVARKYSSKSIGKRTFENQPAFEKGGAKSIVAVPFWLVAWHSGRTSVSGQRTYPVLRSTCSWLVTTTVGKPSAAGQPTRPTQPFVLSGSINEY